VRNDVGEEVGDRYFSIDEGEIRTILPLMPSMLTANTEAIRQDCLCYLMERTILSKFSKINQPVLNSID